MIHPRTASRRLLGALLVLSLLFPAILIGCASTAAQIPDASAPPAEPITSEAALETFDAAWTTIHEQHFDPEFNGVDWLALRDELRPQAAAAEDRDELRTVIREMLGRLGQSHFGIFDPQGGDQEDDPTAESQEGGPGLDVRVRDGRVLVTRVDEEGPAWNAGVGTGWVLVEVDGEDVQDLIEAFEPDEDPREVSFAVRRRLEARFLGAPGSTLTLGLLDDQETHSVVVLERAMRDVLVSRFGNLSTFYLRFHAEMLERSGRSYGLIHFSNWFLPVARPIDEAVDRMRDSDGIVLDLRGNSGGALALVMGTAGHFFDDRRDLGQQIMRTSTLTYRANPRRVSSEGERVKPFAGPLAILVDETSASASEVFAGALQAVGRARVFGEVSAGAVLPARTTALPTGDVMLHAMADFHTPDGTRLEGRGVVPDEIVPVRREDLLAGLDAQLEAALSWLGSQDDDHTADQ